LKNLTITKKTHLISAIALCFVLFNVSCRKLDGIIPYKDNSSSPGQKNEPAPTVVEYNFDSDSNSGLMFQDGESMALLTSETRRYEIGKVLRVKAVDSTTIEVANFAPVDILDATILLTIEGQAKPIKLFKIGKVRAHAVKVIPYSFIKGSTKFLNTDNRVVDLAQYKKTGIPTAKVSFDFTGTTDLIIKLKSLAKLKWTIKYHDFDPKDNPADNWKDNINAKDVRRFTGLMINLAYMLQADTTQKAFLAEPITDNNKVLMTTQQKQQAFNSILNIPKFNCGVVVNVSGLGGGSTFGLADYLLVKYMAKNICFEAVHEIGHMVGFSHSSSMTYPTSDNRGAVVATGNMYLMMIAKGLLPIKTSNYYKPSDL
jgi:hypothetical protein